MGRIELGDSIQLIKSVETESVHLILSDIIILVRRIVIIADLPTLSQII